MKGSARGVDFHQGRAEEDPFAELADIFESEIGREAFRAAPSHPGAVSGRMATPSATHRAPPTAYDFGDAEMLSLDQDFDAAFADALNADMAGTRSAAPFQAPRAEMRPQAAPAPESAYQSWIAPRGTRATTPDEPVSRRRQTVAAPTRKAQGGTLESDLELAIRGLSAPANPRDTIVVETQSFAPERIVEDERVETMQPELDDFDELIASELAVLHDHSQGTMQAQTAAYETRHHDRSVGLDQDGDPSGAFEDFDDDTTRYVEPQRKRGVLGGRILALSGGVVSLAIAGAVGLFVWNGSSLPSGLSGSGEPLLIKADAEPYKVLPKDPGGRSIPNQNKAVYDRVSAPGAQASPTQAALLTDAEEPMDLPADDEPASYDNLPGVDMMTDEGADAKDEGRIAAAEPEADPIPVLQPRKVRTMVVRPDGTLVPAEAAVAAPLQTAAAAAPAPAPVTANGAPALIEVSSPAVPRDTAAPTVPYSSAMAGEASAPAEETLPPQAEAMAPAEPSAGVPMQVADPIEVAAIAPPAPEPAAAPAAPAPTPTGGYFVQISSQPSEALAQASLQSLGSRYSNLIEGRSVGIQSAEIPGKGTFYRVRVATASKDEASALCNRLKSAGGNCFVAR